MSGLVLIAPFLLVELFVGVAGSFMAATRFVEGRGVAALVFFAVSIAGYALFVKIAFDEWEEPA